MESVTVGDFVKMDKVSRERKKVWRGIKLWYCVHINKFISTLLQKKYHFTVTGLLLQLKLCCLLAELLYTTQYFTHCLKKVRWTSEPEIGSSSNHQLLEVNLNSIMNRRSVFCVFYDSKVKTFTTIFWK